MKLPQDAMNEIVSFLRFKDVWRLRSLNRQVAHFVLTNEKIDQMIERGFSECAERNKLRIQGAICKELIHGYSYSYQAPSHQAYFATVRFPDWVSRNLAIRKLIEEEKEANGAPNLKVIKVDLDNHSDEGLDEEISKSRFVLDRFNLER